MTPLFPHCFGYTASFVPNGAFCKQCEFGTKCAKKVLCNLTEINKIMEVKPQMLATQTYLDKKGIARERVITSSSKSIMKFEIEIDLSEQSARVSRLARNIIGAGINMIADARQSVNNFNHHEPSYLRNIQYLLNTRSEFTRDNIKAAIIADRALSAKALSNTASLVITTLLVMHIIELRRRGVYALNQCTI